MHEIGLSRNFKTIFRALFVMISDRALFVNHKDLILKKIKSDNIIKMTKICETHKD